LAISCGLFEINSDPANSKIQDTSGIRGWRLQDFAVLNSAESRRIRQLI
jgi:hypothetical protein